MEALRTWLKGPGRSQAKLAREMEVSQPTVWAWVNGKAKPTVENLVILSRITGLSSDLLIAAAAAVDPDLDQTARARA